MSDDEREDTQISCNCRNNYNDFDDKIMALEDVNVLKNRD